MLSGFGVELRSYNFTAEGLEQLRQSIAELKQQQRMLVSEMHETKTQSTTLHTLEDSLYTIDQWHVLDIDRQIRILETIVEKAHIITKPLTNGRVQLGSTVTILLGKNDLRKYRIVGALEADPLNGSLSEESPLGKRLMGKRCKDIVDAPCPADMKRTAQIIAIT